ncbi:MAG: helix-turn-helix domain-containing protein [Candidatus Cryptobacteroides sp.]|nr:helix-turn-helix transcriptional regulator [Bacteroidales bacterium]
MNARLDLFLKAKNITQSQFADKINVARASVSHILAGRNKPGWEFITNMMQCYPELNIEWLLTGKGEMLKSSSQESVKQCVERTAVQEKEPEVEADLFSSVPSAAPPVSQTATAQERGISGQMGLRMLSEPPTRGSGLPSSPLQIIDNQRKISKIVVFYDDNTFIEIK